jgi:hypothetical protein
MVKDMVWSVTVFSFSVLVVYDLAAGGKIMRRKWLQGLVVVLYLMILMSTPQCSVTECRPGPEAEFDDCAR